MPASYSAQPTRNILIIGATGVIGTYITRAILDARDNFDRICVLTSQKTLVQKVQDIAALDAWGVEIFTGRLEKESAVKRAYEGTPFTHRPASPGGTGLDETNAGRKWIGIDTVVSCVGRGGIEKQINLITWAEQAGVRRFFTSEYGTDIEYWPESAHEPPHQLKLKVRAHMKTMKRLEYTYLVTGPYSDLYFGTMKARPELGQFDVKEKKAVLLGDGEGPVSFTAMAEYVPLLVMKMGPWLTARPVLGNL
ncbi:isoflavone reductase family protein [Cladophialophora carrionii]|uniref:Isoflavone reductase family protein n=1 Tax=Cladophialophora carrionii TaxID=86049 RepID=A0A1C1CUH0_9EURO|nr:isoflavone reductase family protein [Cladophialophora carrionii]